MELAQDAINGTIAQTLAWLQANGFIDKVDPDFVSTWEWRQELLKLFFRGRSAFIERVSRTRESSFFGDWASLSAWEMHRAFGNHTKNLGPLQAHYDVKLSRTLCGAPGVLTFYNKLSVPMFRIVLTESSIMLDSPRWADEVDWGQGVAICESILDATSLNQISISYSMDRRMPVAFLSYGLGQALFTPNPLPVVVFVPMALQNLSKAFLFDSRHTNLSVARYVGHYSQMGRQNLWEVLVRQLPLSQEEGVGWLNEILATPWMTQQSRHRMLTMAATQYGLSPSKLNDLLQPGCSPHCITSPKAHRLFCAHGVMWKMKRDGDPTEISNFALHLLRRHNNGWNVELRVMGKSAYDFVEKSRLDSAAVILRTVRDIAAKHNLPEPIFFDQNLTRYLVALVKTTSLLNADNL